MLFHEYLLGGMPSNKIVLKTIDRDYTVIELEHTSMRVADSLLQTGVSKGDRVVLLMENGFDALMAQLGCSRIGAVFIPVSPQEPERRVRKIIERLTPVLIIAGESGASHLADVVPIATLASGELHFEEHSLRTIEHKIPSEGDLLYIISTSGTTGEPKGIAMSHRAAVEFFKASVDHCQLTPEDNVGTIAPLQFDFSILDLGLALGSNACLTILPQALAYQPKKFIRILKEKNVTQMDSVPSVWGMVLNFCADAINELTQLKSILYAGERFPVKNIRAMQDRLPGLRIVNCFGQSESIACSFSDITNPLPADAKDVSFGQGFPGNIFYIVNDEGERITQPNVVGELWVSNQSLFEGYWDNQSVTEAKLVADPFNASNTNKVFKSGDLVFTDDEGNFYFVGRKDNQVKVKGNRVELDEIAQCLTKHEKISDVIPVAQTRGNETVILVFLSLYPGEVMSVEDIRKYCRSNLPSYMVPEEVVIRERLPLTVNGKIDKKLLMEEYLENIQYAAASQHN
jgi:amino acid adenylation domain-containing protein